MTRIPTAGSGVWMLTDSEMFRLSLYAEEAAKRFRKKGGTELAQEAKEMAAEIDSLLMDTEYYKAMEKAIKSGYPDSVKA